MLRNKLIIITFVFAPRYAGTSLKMSFPAASAGSFFSSQIVGFSFGPLFALSSEEGNHLIGLIPKYSIITLVECLDKDEWH
jgi:hypothetical protein